MSERLRPIGSAFRSDSIVAAWILCVALVLGLVAVVVLSTSQETPFEEQARQELAHLDSAAPEAFRIIVLGASRGRNATGHDPTLEQLLQQSGYDVVVANLAGSARHLQAYEPLLPEILAAEPDLIVAELEIFADFADPPDRGLLARSRRLVGIADEIDYLKTTCQSRSQQILSRRISRNLRIYGRPSPWFDVGADLASDAARQGTAIYLLDLPRSSPLVEGTAETIQSYRQTVAATVGPGENVTLGPRIDLGDPVNYCDYSHLNQRGQKAFFELWLPSFLEYLDRLGS